MKKSESQKFQDFKQQHNLTNTQIKQIMSEYANTEDEYSASFYAAKYNTTARVFYRMRDFTIIFMLVDAPVCKRIRDKSLRNQGSKNASGNCSSANKHYKYLIQKRKEYLKTFSNEEIGLIAVEYANGDALYDIAKKHNISTYTVRKLLAYALAKHLVCETVYHSIKSRSDLFITHSPNFQGFTAENLWNLSHWK